MKATTVALLVVTGLSWQAQAETLALRCEGTKIITERKDELQELLRERFPNESFEEEDTGTKDAQREERASTDVIVTDQDVFAFGAEFETGYRNDALVRFGRSSNNPSTPAFPSRRFLGGDKPHRRHS
jgi:hypothetical protein